MNEIWSVDEYHFQQHGTRCVMWVPPEKKDPGVLHAPTKKSVSFFGAGNLSTGKLLHSNRPYQLLVMCRENGDGWDKLCPFIKADFPSLPFPHMNRTRIPSAL